MLVFALVFTFAAAGGSSKTSSSAPAATSIATATATATVTPAPSTSSCVNPQKRVEWREMSSASQTQYFKAIECLRKVPSVLKKDGAQTLWEDMVDVHAIQAPNIHNTAQFLPWHRSFISIHDQLLLTHCGYAGPYPYYDWSVDSQAPDQSTIWNSFGKNPNGCISIPEINNGADWVTNVPAPLHCVDRQWISANDSTAQLGAPSGALLGSAYSPEALLLISQTNSYDSFRIALESGPHNNFHMGVGGQMGITTSSVNDLIFFLHHRNIDRVWWQWQQANPSLAKTFSGNTPNFVISAKPTDFMRFSGLNADAPVSQALSSISGGLQGDMCFTYSNSITPARAAVVSKRDLSINDVATPDAFDRSHPYNLRPPTKLRQSFLVSWMYDINRILGIRSAEQQLEDFYKFLNSKAINYPTSLKNMQSGNQYGWISKSDEKYAQEISDAQALVAEYGKTFRM